MKKKRNVNQKLFNDRKKLNYTVTGNIKADLFIYE